MSGKLIIAQEDEVESYLIIGKSGTNRGNLDIIGRNGNYICRIYNPSGYDLTDNRHLYIPDKTGTLAVTDDISDFVGLRLIGTISSTTSPDNKVDLPNPIGYNALYAQIDINNYATSALYRLDPMSSLKNLYFGYSTWLALFVLSYNNTQIAWDSQNNLIGTPNSGWAVTIKIYGSYKK